MTLLFKTILSGQIILFLIGAIIMVANMVNFVSEKVGEIGSKIYITMLFLFASEFAFGFLYFVVWDK